MKISLKRNINEIIKFGIVGGICTGIDAVIFYCFHNPLGYNIAIILGFLISIGVNYLLNIYWSFSTRPSIKNAVGVLGAHTFNIFIVRLGLMWLFVEIIDLQVRLAYIPMLTISIITNFLIIRFIVKRY